MTEPEPLVEVEGLALRRGEVRLFAELSFALRPGELVELRGSNGAGKTSLLLALAGVLRPEAGTIRWRGGVDDPVRVHVFGHQAGVKSRLTLAENLRFWQIVNGDAALAPAAALDAVGLGGLGGIDAGYLSAGQTRRLGLARLLVSARPVWLLDEPLAALDTAGAGLLAGLVGAQLAGGGAVLAATHDELGLPAARRLTLERPA